MTHVGWLVLLAALLWPPRGAHGAPPRSLDPRPGGLRQAARLVSRRADRPRRGRTVEQPPPAWVAEVADLAALGLEAGLPMQAALETAAAGTPLVSAVAEALERGQPTGAVLRRAALDEPGLARLAVGWTASERTGAPAAALARAAARLVREDRARAARMKALLAGPRATARLLAGLPLVGPLGVFAVGADVRSVYGNPLALLGGVVGFVLVLLGVTWSRALLRRAGRPTTLREIRW